MPEDELSNLSEFLNRDLMLDPARLSDFFAQAKAEGIVTDFALFGALAYSIQIEPLTTFDADFLFEPSEPLASNLLDLSGVYRLAMSLGATPSGDKLILNAVPFQLLPTRTDLDREALANAEWIEPAGCKVLTPEYIIAIALQLGRSKDIARVIAALDSPEIDHDKLTDILTRHGLTLPC